MRVVNLARRPFVNRRPIVRMAGLMWVIGGLLILTNIWLYADHFRDSSKNQGQLDAFRRQVVEEQGRLDGYWNELRSLNLSGRNARAKYLNGLINQRTFPWSALFDDLERILPLDVYLGTVQPARQDEDEGRTRGARRASSSRTLTPAEARRRARARRNASVDAEPAVEAMQDTATERAKEEGGLESRDRVLLSITGFARSDEAMFELLDRLYADASFEKPDLSRDATELETQGVTFILRVVYLVPRLRDYLTEDGLPSPGRASIAGDLGDEERSSSTPGAVDSPSRPSMRERLAAQGRIAAPSTPDVGSTVTDEGERAGDRRPSRVSVRGPDTRPRGTSGRRPSAEQGEASDRGSSGASPGGRRGRTVPVVPGGSVVGTGRSGSSGAAASGRRTPTRRPSTDLPITRPQRPSAGSDGGTTPTRPQPATPGASSSPQLRQGGLLERLWPDRLLQWIAPAEPPALLPARRAEGLPASLGFERAAAVSLGAVESAELRLWVEQAQDDEPPLMPPSLVLPSLASAPPQLASFDLGHSISELDLVSTDRITESWAAEIGNRGFVGFRRPSARAIKWEVRA